MEKLKYAGLALCCMLVMAGCSEEELVKNNGQQVEGNYTLIVNRVPESRTWLPENPVWNESIQKYEYPTYWSENDRIEVASEDRKVRGHLSLYEGGNTTNARFSGLVNGAHSKLEYAVYPLPNSKGEIELTSRSYSTPNAPMIGTFGADKSRVNFENTCGMFRLVINNYPADKNLIVTGNGISGKAKPVKSGDKWDLQWISDNKNKVTITDTPSEVGKVVFYIPVITDQVLTDQDVNGITPTAITVSIDGTQASITKELKIAKRVVSALESSTFLTLTYHEDTDELTEAWDGTSTGTGIDFTAETVELHGAADLKAFADYVNDGNQMVGQTIKLMNDIDLNNKPWTPISIKGEGIYFKGTFDGQGYCIENINVSGQEYAGLFGICLGATIQNVTLRGGSIEGTQSAGAFFGDGQGSNVLKNVSVDNVLVKKNGVETGLLAVSNWSGTIKLDENYYVMNKGALKRVLTLNEANIGIVLANDLEVDVDAWQTLAFGGKTTETITINGEENTLTFNQLNSDWNHVTTNNKAKLIINNAHITSSGHNDGPWNRHDINFACPVELVDVISNKAIALKNAGTLTNVTINDANTGDTYAIWIQPNGQTVDIEGCTIDMLDCTDGRGIKIDNQYRKEGEEGFVTLNVSGTTFKTEEKSAIIVKTTLGANINLEGNDITGVAADKVCAVWVDEDAASSYDLVIVNGGCKKLEGADFYVDEDGKASTNSNIGLAEAITSGATEVKLEEGEYIIPSVAQGKTLKIVGTGNPEDVNVAVTKIGAVGENCDYGLDGSTVTFEGVTITTNSSTYIGYTRCNGTYKNCIINGTYTLYGNSVFEECEFNVSGDVYNIWTWGAPTAQFTKCTFNCDGKAVLLYGTANTKLTMNNCTFNDNGGLSDLKAAIEIGDDYGKSYELIVNNAIVNGFAINDKGVNTGTTLWANKNSMSTDKLNVVVDGVDVY